MTDTIKKPQATPAKKAAAKKTVAKKTVAKKASVKKTVAKKTVAKKAVTKTEQTYYSLDKISKHNATYNVIFGERSNGKTYALLKEAVRNWAETGKQLAYVRRWADDLKPQRAKQLFAGLQANGEIETLTKGEYTGVHYYSGKWYLCNYDDNRKAVYSDNDVIAYGFALTAVEHDKSTAYPHVNMIVFDEFLTPRMTLPDEFVLFMNVVSTIVRRREDVAIYMLGNTVNKYSPYFEEMGLDRIREMKQGTIDLYSYGDSGLTTAVEYCKQSQSSEANTHKYFAFNNPKLEMITGGAWEMNIYPHLPEKYKPDEILLTYFIEFDDKHYQCEVIQPSSGEGAFTFIHNKTTPLKNPDTDLVYSLEYNHKVNYNRNIFRPMNETQRKILWFYTHDRVFYQNNNVGDAIKNYLQLSKRG